MRYILLLFILASCGTDNRLICRENFQQCMQPETLGEIVDIMDKEDLSQHRKECYDKLRRCLK